MLVRTNKETVSGLNTLAMCRVYQLRRMSRDTYSLRLEVFLVMTVSYHPVLAKTVDYIRVEIMKLLWASVISVILVACNVDSCHREVVKLCLWG